MKSVHFLFLQYILLVNSSIFWVKCEHDFGRFYRYHTCSNRYFSNTALVLLRQKRNLRCLFWILWGFSKRAPLFLLEFSENYQINLSRTFWSNCSRMSGFFCLSEGRQENGTVIKKGTGIAPSCCKKKYYPERRRYATPPKETERKVCSRSELCIGCPFPTSGFICWGSGDDCLRSRYMKLQNREESKWSQ